MAQKHLVVWHCPNQTLFFIVSVPQVCQTPVPSSASTQHRPSRRKNLLSIATNQLFITERRLFRAPVKLQHAHLRRTPPVCGTDDLLKLTSSSHPHAVRQISEEWPHASIHSHQVEHLSSVCGDASLGTTYTISNFCF